MDPQIIIPALGCATLFGIIYIIVAARNRKDISMIEAGMNPMGSKASKSKKHAKLRLALLAICVPLGILVGNAVHSIFDMHHEPAAILFAILFGGFALTATYFIENSQKQSFEEE